MEGVKLNKNILDYRDNQTPNGYGIGQKRGTYNYILPLGWRRFDLMFQINMIIEIMIG